MTTPQTNPDARMTLKAEPGAIAVCMLLTATVLSFAKDDRLDALIPGLPSFGAAMLIVALGLFFAHWAWRSYRAGA